MRAEEDDVAFPVEYPQPPAEAPKYKTFAPFSDEEWQALDVAHGDTRKVRGAVPPPKPWDPSPEPKWEVIFRKPANAGEFAFFEKHAHSDTAKDRALRLYAKALIVGVSEGGRKVVCLNVNDNKQKNDVRNAWDALCEKFPGIHMAAQQDIMDLSGMGKEEAGKD